MKTFLSLVIVSSLFVACGQNLSRASSTKSSEDIGIPELTNFVATVKDAPNQAAFTKECARKIKAISGVSVKSVLESTGVISFTSIPQNSRLVAHLNCVLSVEEDLEGGIHKRGSIASASPAMTSYIATVKDASNQGAFTKECANKVKSIGGISITNVLGTSGIISFVSSQKKSELVAKLSCVLSVEVDQAMGPLPSTRVGN